MTHNFKQPPRKSMVRAALLLAAVGFFSSANGQTGQWTKAAGAASDLAASAGGTWAVGYGTNDVYWWSSIVGWMIQNFKATSVSADDYGTCFGTNGAQLVERPAGTLTAPIPHNFTTQSLISVATHPTNRTVWAMDASFNVWVRQGPNGTPWTKATTLALGGAVKRILTDGGTGFWAITSSGLTHFDASGNSVAPNVANVQPSEYNPYGNSYVGLIKVDKNQVGWPTRVAFEAKAGKLWAANEKGEIYTSIIPTAAQVSQAFTTAAQSVKAILDKIQDSGTAQTYAPDLDPAIGAYLAAKRNAEYWLLSSVNTTADVDSARNAMKTAESALETRRTAVLSGAFAPSVGFYFNNLLPDYRGLIN